MDEDERGQQANDPGQARREVAEEVAAAYACHPSVKAVILGGSVARDTARPDSDIGLGIFWWDLGSDGDRNDVLTRVSGKLIRRVSNAARYAPDNPRRRGLIEIVRLHRPGPATWDVDLEHETVEGAEQTLAEVVEGLDTSIERIEMRPRGRAVR